MVKEKDEMQRLRDIITHLEENTEILNEEIAKTRSELNYEKAKSKKYLEQLGSMMDRVADLLTLNEHLSDAIESLDEEVVACKTVIAETCDIKAQNNV